ncbi:MAG TPA: redoxin domain-containing protein [Myxococcota bacterium]|nr:redoxin domain-containing protein [Myxococcota bacterium]
MSRSFRTLALASISSVILLGACADQALVTRVNDLETRVKAIEDKGTKPAAAAPGATPPAPTPPSPEDEAAMALYKEAAELSAQGKTDDAKAKLTELDSKYGTSRANQAGKRLMAELSVVGKDISELEVSEWFQGKASLADNKATLVVFWEVWCPHCKREVPKLQETYTKYKDKGFGVVGLTKLSRGKTVDELKAFISENQVGYPIAKENDAGSMSSFFGVNGVPAAAVVKGGKVVWRGHPAQINDGMIDGWIN